MHIMQKFVPFRRPASTSSSIACRSVSDSPSDEGLHDTIKEEKGRLTILVSDSLAGNGTKPGSVTIPL